MNRKQALSIPAVSKARNLLITAVLQAAARHPRRSGRHRHRCDDRQLWLYRTNGVVSPYERMAWTIDDAIFYGCSLWLLDRGTPDKDGKRAILNAEWCPTGTWSIKNDEAGILRVYVDGVAIADDRYLLLNWPFEGLLNIGQRTLRGARDIEESWVGRARNPIPLIELKVTDGSTLEDGEIGAWSTRSQSRGPSRTVRSVTRPKASRSSPMGRPTQTSPSRDATQSAPTLAHT